MHNEIELNEANYNILRDFIASIEAINTQRRRLHHAREQLLKEEGTLAELENSVREKYKLDEPELLSVSMNLNRKSEADKRELCEEFLKGQRF